MSQRTSRICSFEPCGRPHKGHGLCNGHLIMTKRGEELRPLRRRRRPHEDIRNYFWSQVNKDGDCWIWTKSKDRKGYGQFYPEQLPVRAHRFAYEQVHGELSKDILLDHICRNRGCVNPSHLRPVDQSQNAQNLPQRSRKNTSGYRGVSQDKRDGKWTARATKRGRTYSAGRYNTPEEAALAAANLRSEIFTHSTN